MMTRSQSTTRITSLMKLNWLRAAVENARSYNYQRDPWRQRATRELEEVGGLLLEIMAEPETTGPMDLGREFVDRRAEQLRRLR